MGPSRTDSSVAAILHASWPVRAHFRPWQAAERAAAIRELGLVCRKAFNTTDDFEALLMAIVDGLNQREARF